ncbi:MAG: T9SS C-terminal target domain-containing protein [Candidatus Latescibacterota bacterium]|nr:MAG: T9SS C-terminal target domain-containing protein [Candidatus Latescibacterota bacterium]
MKRAPLALVLAVVAASPVYGEEFTLLSWNLLNYPGSDGTARAAHFRTVLPNIGPDVIVVQEMLGQAGVTHFRSNVLETIEPGAWSAGPFHDSYDTDNALFFRSAAVEVLEHGWLDTALRDIDWWQVRLLESGEEMRVYSLHLKASQGSEEEEQRLGECTILRDALEALPASLPYAVAGDYNIYTASEPAYEHLVEPGTGSLRDPIDREGAWHDNAAFAAVHTQSTRTTSFGGGATGGMDDRFDLILVGEEMMDGVDLEIDPESYTAYGNDGVHFNQSIVQNGNSAVPAPVADALHQASDHLPIFAVLRVEPATEVAGSPVPERHEIRIAPNPFNATAAIRFTVAAPSPIRLVLFDAAGREVKTLAAGVFGAGTHDRTWDGTDAAGREAASGIYFARLAGDSGSVVEKLVLVR